uniref:Retrovirus-related Pol polyprotein from transposon 17.6 n=1 Tax=Cajanus cajan TaxID=3821 RepID=A0A151TEG4_CAJCA|nr:Retrovirus-related Pol polyprotein from transposon 17.6 [Cajanus cajan]
MVRKSNGKWRMCTDFIDLNKACPKDSYLLPNIDYLVNGASGYELLSFKDAYSGYNQIRMHSADEDKTTFITDQANFCYRVMPSALKNAGATYQGLMDKVFVNQLGRNVEAYVDDMVVKSASIDRHFDDLQELFDTIGKYQLKLNPEKCSFEVQAGKFLGFLLTHHGIEANPDKCSAIINMRSPSTMKEVQQLAGRMASLSRFLSRAVDKALPLIQCLKKNDRFT